MSMINTPIMVFAWILIVVVIFISLNTILIGNIYPVMEDLAHNMTFVNQNRFTDINNMSRNVFYFIFAVMLAIPFIFLLVKAVLSREPGAGQGGFVNAFSL